MEIVKIPHKILHTKVQKIPTITPEIQTLIDVMGQTMREVQGIGLAANQIGKAVSLFVIDEEFAKEHNVPETYINPELSIYSKEETILEEACLSIPDAWLELKRAKKIKIKAQDKNGDKFKLIAKGMLARVLQHEYDHLQGILITDYAKK